MKRLTILAALIPLALAGTALGSTEDLDALVEKVRQEALLEASHDQERIDRFLIAEVKRQGPDIMPLVVLLGGNGLQCFEPPRCDKGGCTRLCQPCHDLAPVKARASGHQRNLAFE